MCPWAMFRPQNLHRLYVQFQKQVLEMPNLLERFALFQDRQAAIAVDQKISPNRADTFQNNFPKRRQNFSKDEQVNRRELERRDRKQEENSKIEKEEERERAATLNLAIKRNRILKT